MIYSNFFTPSVISMLFCLHQSTVQVEEKDPRSHIVQFLIKKILAVTDSEAACQTNQQFEAKLLSETSDNDFLERYRESLSKIQNFNDFYRELSRMLKTLRSLRNNKLQQGNLIDFLIRRMYIYFQKLDFKEIVKIYQRFEEYCRGVPVKVPQHEFMLTKSIEEIKFNLQNYSGWANDAEQQKGMQGLDRRIEEVKSYDHTNKSSYLSSVLRAGQHRPIEAVEAMHRYFDKSLGNLFQEKSEVSLMSNKINHCILSNAFINLQMEGLQECLQSISEGLRISQNNSDEESINNCIIYLYRIAQQLGKHQQEILLNEHAITHSLNLTNTLLMVYSCLNYSILEKRHHCQDPNIVLLKHRNIAWTEALHFSKKKLYNTFESNCKNIYHCHRSLLLPVFITKLATLEHLPQLTPLLLNPYYQRPQLTRTQIYQEFKGISQLNYVLNKTKLYAKTNQLKLVAKQLQLLQAMQHKALSPTDILKIKDCINRTRLDCPAFVSDFRDTQEQVELCQRWGFVREQLLEAKLLSVRVLMANGLLEDALVTLQQATHHCHQQKLSDFSAGCQLWRVRCLLDLGKEFKQAVACLQAIEQSCQSRGMRRQFRVLFTETQAIAYGQLYNRLKHSTDCYEVCQGLKQRQIETLQGLLRLHLEDSDLVRTRQTLQEIEGIQLLHPTLMQRNHGERLKVSRSYCEQVCSLFAGLDNQNYDQQQLVGRVVSKLTKLYFP